MKIVVAVFKQASLLIKSLADWWQSSLFSDLVSLLLYIPLPLHFSVYPVVDKRLNLANCIFAMGRSRQWKMNDFFFSLSGAMAFPAKATAPYFIKHQTNFLNAEDTLFLLSA